MKNYQIRPRNRQEALRWVESLFHSQNRRLPEGWKLDDAPVYCKDGYSIRFADTASDGDKLKDKFPLRNIKDAIADPLWIGDDSILIWDTVEGISDGKNVWGRLVGISYGLENPYIVELEPGINVMAERIWKSRPRMKMTWEELEDALGCELDIV